MYALFLLMPPKNMAAHAKIAILNYSHILCLQETHLFLFDDFSLREHFKNYNIYYCNGDGGGGLCILSHKSLRNHYDIKEYVLGQDAVGRVQGIRYDPIIQSNGDRQVSPFNVLNWHFEGDKIAQMKTLLRIRVSVRTIGGGVAILSSMRKMPPVTILESF
jgi:hypothetical protein